ncbi:MAG: hypothetical protein HY908_02915 [Myxococcales bacterium]|nr:hypothetical protein [Myxococcales bacterium]
MKRRSRQIGWARWALGLGITLVPGIPNAWAGEPESPAEPAAASADEDTGAKAVAEVAQAPTPGATPGAATPGAQPPATSFAAPASGDAEDEESVKGSAVPPHVPWRGTSFRWSHAGTTSGMGVGADFQSVSHQEYTQTFALTLNYFFVDLDDWTFRVSTTPSFTTEITDSADTTTKHEPWFDDLPLLGTFGFKLYAHDELPLSTRASVAGGFIFPTSPASYGGGTYVTTTTRVGLSQEIPLAGNDSPVFKSFVVGLSGRWDHRFGAASTPVNGDLQYPRQTSTGETFLSDQLDVGGLAHDTLRESISITFSEEFAGQSLEVSPAFGFVHSFKSGWDTETCVQTLTGCATAMENPDTRTSFNRLGFSLSVGYYPVPEVGVEFGYANLAGQLGANGQRRNIFYSPAAQFTADLVVSFDAIYERIARPARNSPYVVRNKQRQPLYAGTTTGSEGGSPSLLSF